jgi:hypothetical protein
MVGWRDGGWMDAWIEGWRDGWRDGRMDGVLKNIKIGNYIYAKKIYEGRRRNIYFKKR